MTYENIHSYTNKIADIFTYEKPALLVVDMQKGFCYPGKQFYSSENIKLVPAISTLLEYFRGNNLPVYFTEFVYSKDCPNLNGRLWQCERDYDEGGERCCYVGDPSTETIDELKPLPGELVIQKRGYDAFFGTDLDYCLRTKGIKTLIVVGILAEQCILSTVSSAFHYEYEVTLASDCTRAIYDDVNDATLRLIDYGFGNVYTSADIIRILEAKKES